MLAWILSRPRCDLGCDQVHDRPVLVGGPYAAVASQETRPRALLAAKTNTVVEESRREPLEADGHFVQAPAKFGHDAIDYAAGHNSLSDRTARRPIRAVRQQVLNRDRQEMIRIHQTY